MPGWSPPFEPAESAGSDTWFIVTMTPGVHPFESLERALTKVAVNTPPMLLEQLLAEPSGLRRAADAILPDQMSPLVLVVDQFEELYTVAADDEREAFTEALVEASTHPRSRLRVVITLRADFYDHPLGTPGLGELLRDHTELVTPMTASELELAITRPAATAGVVVQPALVAALMADAVSKPGVLPMLQYTLTELFERQARSDDDRHRLRVDGGTHRSRGRAGRVLVRGPHAGGAFGRAACVSSTCVGERGRRRHAPKGFALGVAGA